MQSSYLKNSQAITLVVGTLLVLGAACLPAQAVCTNSDLTGGFGFKITGTNVALKVEFAATGKFEADGQGKITGSMLESVGGQFVPVPFKGTYSVNQDCTGKSTFTFPDGAQANLSFILVDNGNEAIFMVSDPGAVETGTATKQFPRHHKEN